MLLNSKCEICSDTFRGTTNLKLHIDSKHEIEILSVKFVIMAINVFNKLISNSKYLYTKETFTQGNTVDWSAYWFFLEPKCLSKANKHRFCLGKVWTIPIYHEFCLKSTKITFSLWFCVELSYTATAIQLYCFQILIYWEFCKEALKSKVSPLYIYHIQHFDNWQLCWIFSKLGRFVMHFLHQATVFRLGLSFEGSRLVTNI